MTIERLEEELTILKLEMKNYLVFYKETVIPSLQLDLQCLQGKGLTNSMYFFTYKKQYYLFYLFHELHNVSPKGTSLLVLIGKENDYPLIT